MKGWVRVVRVTTTQNADAAIRAEETDTTEDAGAWAGDADKQAGERDTTALVLDALSALARFGLAFMWIYSGWTKIGVHMDVTKSITAYEIFTPYWSELLARVIGPAEIAGGLLLLLGIKIRPAGWVSLGVLVLFIIGLYSAYTRGLNIDCGCFGPQPSGDGADLLIAIARDAGLIAATLFMIYRPYTRFALYP